MKAAVFAEPAAVGCAHDGAGVVGHIGAQEVRHLDLADEADPLAVFFVGVGQAGLARQPAQLGLFQVADGKTRIGELCR